MRNDSFPKLATVRQKFPKQAPVDISAAVRREMAEILPRVKRGARIAVTAGSRGITNIDKIVKSVVDQLRGAGAMPFVMPAMGSHGGATPEGQAGILEEYGITEKTMGVPIRPSLEVRQVATTSEGIPVFCSVEALNADGIVLVNRIKPHTDFSANIGSGIMKISVIGLGKRTGAAACHAAATRLGLARVIRSVAERMLQSAPILCGIGIIENQFHETSRLALLKPENLIAREEELFVEAKALMPRLPFEEIDLLIVDRLGKNISGSGMDPNVIGRGVHGYSSSLAQERTSSPHIRRIFVRDLTSETHGNAIGIGLADFTTARLVRGMNKEITYVNSMTSITPQGAKIPIHFETDREALEVALQSLAMEDLGQAKIVRIRDTLSVVEFEISETLLGSKNQRDGLEKLSAPRELVFDSAGNLAEMAPVK